MAEFQYAIFNLDDEKYGVDILNVAGITEVPVINKVPNSPAYVEGIMNLRGDVIPVVNLKKRFGYEDASFAKSARIMLISIDNGTIGYIVDETNQVIKFSDEDIEDTPAMLKTDDKRFIKAIGKHKGEIYILLDMQKILSDLESHAVASMAI
jgi:purine-binding chemotaxis protein CheW